MLSLKGEKVTLRPMKKDERELFYRWAVSSDATPFWYGKLYGDKVPSRKMFFKDWKPHYFDDGKPKLGRCFVILVEGRKIGQVNYNRIEKGAVELDIIIADSKDWGKGYGSDAIKTLTSYLFGEMDAKIVWIAAHRKNKHAIRAYQRAGLAITEKPPGYIKITEKGAVNKRDWVVFIKENN